MSSAAGVSVAVQVKPPSDDDTAVRVPFPIVRSALVKPVTASLKVIVTGEVSPAVNVLSATTMAVAIGRVASTARPVSRPLAPRKLAASRLAAGVKVFSSTDTVLPVWFATTRSARPSPLTSAVVAENGWLPATKLVCAPNVPSPLPSSTDTVLLLWFAVMRSTLPSPLTSAVVTDRGRLPTA